MLRRALFPQSPQIFSGLQAVVVAIVANAAFSFGRTNTKALAALADRHGISAVLFWLGVNALFVILAWPRRLVGCCFPPDIAGIHKPADPAGIPALRAALADSHRGRVAGVALAGSTWLAPDLFRLALLMFKIDLMAFGGGFGSVPIMYHEVVEVNGWVAGPTFMNGILLGQMTPAPS
jgi:chromate transporter